MDNAIREPVETSDISSELYEKRQTTDANTNSPYKINSHVAFTINRFEMYLWLESIIE